MGFRFPSEEFAAWREVCAAANVPMADFLRGAVAHYLDPGAPPPPLPEREEPPRPRPNSETDTGSGRVYFNLRLSPDQISAWDDFCRRTGLSRTALVRHAVGHLLSNGTSYVPVSPFYHVLRQAILNFVKFTGIAKFDDVAYVFDRVDASSIQQMLGDLETEGELMRKGALSYVPTSVREHDVPLAAIVEDLGAFVSSAWDSNELPSVDDQRALCSVIFDYFDLLTWKVRRGSEKDLSALRELTESLKEVLDEALGQLSVSGA
ncbi:MAG: hypothetical protein Kow0069_08650 [Promethearchaeota archaeon]